MNIRIDRGWRLARKGDRKHIPCALKRLEYLPDPLEKIDIRTWDSPYDYTIGLPVYTDGRFLLTILPTAEAFDYIMDRKSPEPLHFGPVGRRGIRVAVVEICLPKGKRDLMQIELRIDHFRVPKQWL